MTSKNRVSLKIAGKEYNVVATESEEYIRKVGSYVDNKLSEIMRNSVKLNTHMASVLAAINLADDLFKAREAENYFKDELLKMKKQMEELRKDNDNVKGDLQSLKLQNKELHKVITKREAELEKKSI